MKNDLYFHFFIWSAVAVFVLWFIGAIIQSRRQIRRAQTQGMWPQPGTAPTLENVQRLAQSGEKILAIRLYRQMNPGLGLKEAKDIVEKLADSRNA